MTSDAARKRQARTLARRLGIAYSEAVRRVADTAAGSPRCIDLASALQAGLDATGLTAILHGPEMGQYLLYAGPATVTISRKMPWPGPGDDDPDNDIVYDVDEPPSIDVNVPLLGEALQEWFSVAPGSAESMARQFHDGLGAGPPRGASARLVDEGECAICGDAYPAGHLVRLGFDDPSALCPACPFDGDLLRDVFPEQTALTLQELLYQEPAAPAGWAGVIALLVCSAAPEAVPSLWVENLHTLSDPEPYWSDPAKIWVWLPPANARPDWLAEAGVVLDLGALVARVNECFPDASTTLIAELDAEWGEGQEADAVGRRAADVFQTRLWPALLAYAVSFATQVAERSGHREPWHVTESFEEGRLSPILTDLGSPCDPNEVEMTMCTVERLAGLLGLRSDRHPDPTGTARPPNTAPRGRS